MLTFLNHKLDQLHNILFNRNVALAYLYTGAAAINLALWGMLFANIQTVYRSSREFITLHYKVGIGPDFVGPWYALFAVPLFGLVILLFNCIAGKMVYHHERFSVYALAVTALCVQGILGWALYLPLKANLF